MSFSIDSLLEKGRSSKSSEENTLDESAGPSGAGATSIYPWVNDRQEKGPGTGGAGPSNPSALVGLAPLPAALAMPNQQLPTLADLQLLFGGGGPKAHYRRNRRSGADRKPRQAYSSKQLEKLEDEFKKDKYLSVSKRVELSKTLNLSETQIKTWFQNRRTKWKKQVTASLRQLYRHGLYSQYAAAAVAAAASAPCFQPIMVPSAPTLFGSLTMASEQPQLNPGIGVTPMNPWTLQGTSLLTLPGGTQGPLRPECIVEESAGAKTEHSKSNDTARSSARYDIEHQ